MQFVRNIFLRVCGKLIFIIIILFFYLRQPEVKVLDARVEVLLLVGFFEFLALFCRFVDEELPLFIKSTEASLRTGPIMYQNYYLLTETLLLIHFSLLTF